MGIIIPLLLIVFSSLIIWRASNGFDDASSFLGRNLTEGVKGATINAISSSIPELLTSIFFLIYLKDSEGFSGGLGTIAGSAVFNAMVIPALSIIVVIYYGISKTIEVSKKVIYRDSIALITLQIVLIFIIYFQLLNIIGGTILVSLYFIYVIYMITSMKAKSVTSTNYSNDIQSIDVKNRFISFLKLDLSYALIGNEKTTNTRAVILLLTSLLFMGASCLVLVWACELIGEKEYSLFGYNNLKGLNIPISVVAIIIAAAATSIPDTILSVKDALKGNYNDAISNAIGSNVFDIGFAIGFPILVYSILYNPIILSEIVQEFSLKIMTILLILTLITFIILISNKKIGLVKGLLLLGLYFIFISYILLN
jgi:cation:H+ antiporter|tara:strand:- start:533 stop:1636 length:1104 start_codon:yes stop_codon:yes gene_type:complete